MLVYFNFESKRAIIKLGGFSRTFAEIRYGMSLGTVPGMSKTISQLQFTLSSWKIKPFAAFFGNFWQ